MRGLPKFMGIVTLSFALLVMLASGPVCAAEYSSGGIVGSPTPAPPAAAPAPPGTTTTTTPAPPAAPPASAEKSTYFSGGSEFSVHKRPMGADEVETLQGYRIKTWRNNYIRVMKERRAEKKAMLKKRRLRRLYPVSALASIQVD